MVLWIYTLTSDARGVYRRVNEEPKDASVILKRNLGCTCPIITAFALCPSGTIELDILTHDLIGVARAKPETIPVITALRKISPYSDEITRFCVVVKALYIEDVQKRTCQK